MKSFIEDSNTAVFTTKYVLFEHSPILFVFHDTDNYWSFNGKEKCKEDADYKIIALSEAIIIDPTITEVADMPTGYMAEREKIGDKWQISPYTID
jgi:hypothetical protein